MGLLSFLRLAQVAYWWNSRGAAAGLTRSVGLLVLGVIKSPFLCSSIKRHEVGEKGTNLTSAGVRGWRRTILAGAGVRRIRNIIAGAGAGVRRTRDTVIAGV